MPERSNAQSRRGRRWKIAGAALGVVVLVVIVVAVLRRRPALIPGANDSGYGFGSPGPSTNTTSGPMPLSAPPPTAAGPSPGTPTPPTAGYPSPTVGPLTGVPAGFTPWQSQPLIFGPPPAPAPSAGFVAGGAFTH